MGKKLVIVESPAKAKTISRFLGNDYVVEASFGHVRDLPESAKDIPAELKKEDWAKLGVNVEDGFRPLYVVPSEKARHVANLRKAAKDVSSVLLATDEDREGESISWHVLELLKPKKSVEVKRIVFHEITPEAIQTALENPRDLDENLVRAQETRRVLDRLYGYSLSPVLWNRVAPSLSAGRVQSVAVRLLVERERDRMAFVPAEYWDLVAMLAAADGQFEARLVRIDGQRIATGKSFEPTTGQLKSQDRWLQEPEAKDIAEQAAQARPWKVAKLESTPGRENPPPPFMTSTLQQEANRKLRMPARRTMQVAQVLYEGVDLGGERVGLITYMRTDSLTLSERALEQAREVIRELYGPEFLPAKPNRYKTKSKGAQEAHEAIRPTDLSRKPQDLQSYLTPEQLSLYELIWKRTIACQMKPAEVLRTQLEVAVPLAAGEAILAASGKAILFPGFLRAYVEGSDDPEAEISDKERVLPNVQLGQELEPKHVEAEGHTTKAPARYTEASLVKKLEEEGIGRPSTYASIIGTIQDRGYCFKQGAELVPTFSAFAVTGLLEEHFGELVDLRFTARMEEELDDIAEGSRDAVPYLREFYLGGEAKPGIRGQVDKERIKSIPYPRMELGQDGDGNPILVGVGRYGAFLQRGEDRVSLPAEMAPADLTVVTALELLARKNEGPRQVGEFKGMPVHLKKGPYGTYLEAKDPEAKTPRRVTVPPGLSEAELDASWIERLMTLPRALGQCPETGQEITANVGRYGAYLKRGEENRTLEPWDRVFTITAAEAAEVYKAPKPGRGGKSATRQVLKEFPAEGELPALQVLTGYYGPYVTDGTTNATIPKSQAPDTLTVEQARELIAVKAAKGPGKGSPRRAAGRRTKK